ncbi:hypothetical protein OSB04_011134 [Centaurea solstitialis]|uniref:Leucine-rich repeat-containing N-terminal plant-type domain-containing protein n=1 Tax=Centaurea solstitialis TaxID=347529 RepID=A0AA38WL84_9ASTR|nr:hypothetical protein OSB04_011134 [Centaurea solstitialis]
MATTRTRPLLILYFLFILDSILISSISCPLHQKQALLEFKSTLNTIFGSVPNPEYPYQFEDLDSWNPDYDCCSWDLVNCSRTGTVTELDLGAVVPYMSNLVPVLCDNFTSLFRIRSLKKLDISSNDWIGEIPGDRFRNLTELVELRLRNSRFHGTIPSQLFDLKSLRVLDLSFNKLNGSLSPKVGKLQNLIFLNLNWNSLTGNIPAEIGNLTKLRHFSIRGNNLFGRIPSSIGNMKELQSLELSGNSLSMQIPAEIGGLPNITILDLRSNELTGPIPSSLCNLSKLETLRLQKNKLSGEIPTSLFQITTLKDLFIGEKGNKDLIWNNRTKIVPRCSLVQMFMPSCGISNEIPIWISSQKDLRYLDLSGNQLEGRFPDWLAKMDTYGILLSDNKLTGSIPPPLFESRNLAFLDLSGNNFSGKLPEKIGNIKSMRMLVLSRNKFSGQIPMSFSNLKSLEFLDLSGNRLSGDKFPNFNDRRLFYLDLSYNNLSGKILMNLFERIEYLFLGGNKFSGYLSWNLTTLVNLKHLDLHNNDIRGSFQDILPHIQNLEVLNIRNNSIEGFIPRRISNLTSLRILDVSGNNLRGCIPQELAHLASMIEIPPPISDFGYYDGIYNTELEIQDSIVNWKNSFQGLSGRRLSLYSFLDLSDNKISCEIPVSLGNLKGLKVLNISHNNISGHIPVSFGNLKGVESLDLSHNTISGSMPPSLAKLGELTILDVSNNRLTGKIPMGGQMDTMNELSYFANNSGLCGMQIRITCPEDIPPSKGREEDGEKQSWILWDGTWIGFLIGFFSSILMMGYSLNFLPVFKFW